MTVALPLYRQYHFRGRLLVLQVGQNVSGETTWSSHFYDFLYSPFSSTEASVETIETSRNSEEVALTVLDFAQPNMEASLRTPNNSTSRRCSSFPSSKNRLQGQKALSAWTKFNSSCRSNTDSDKYVAMEKKISFAFTKPFPAALHCFPLPQLLLFRFLISEHVHNVKVLVQHHHNFEQSCRLFPRVRVRYS